MKSGTILLLAALGSAVVLMACAPQRPVMYPNQKLKSVDEQVLKQDVDECLQLSEKAGHKTDPGQAVASETAKKGAKGAAVGAAVGAVGGNVGKGAGYGAAGGAAAGMMDGIFKSGELKPVQRRFVEQCLTDKGYQVIGWE